MEKTKRRVRHGVRERERGVPGVRVRPAFILNIVQQIRRTCLPYYSLIFYAYVSRHNHYVYVVFQAVAFMVQMGYVVFVFAVYNGGRNEMMRFFFIW